MSVAEIIEQIKALPVEEQREVFDFVRQASGEKEGTSAVRYMEPSAFRAAKARVFETHEDLLRRLAQ